jgi:ribonuclease D
MYSQTPLVMVATDADLATVAERLEKVFIIGVDTESDSFYSYEEKVCLLQISDSEADYIIDPLKVRDLSPLAPVMSNPAIVKILHGADYDVVCLKRDFGFQFSNLFDTLIAAQLLGLPKIGLADLIQRFFGFTVDKQYQRHNWSLRPLQNEHLDYARGDTHWLLALRELLQKRLVENDRVRHAEEECALLEKREWARRGFDPSGFLKIKQAKSLENTELRVLRSLYIYRNQQAKQMNRPTFKVIPDSVLVSLAKAQPKDLRGLDKLFPAKNSMKRRHGKAMVQAIDDGLADDTPLPKAPRKNTKTVPKKGKPRLTGRVAERALGELKAWRNDQVANNRRLTPFTVASNTTLKSIASMRPFNLQELQDVPEVRKWQVQDFGEQILDVLERIAPQKSS